MIFNMDVVEVVYSSHVLPVLSILRVHWILSLVAFVSLYTFVSYLLTFDALKRVGLPGPPCYPIVGTSLGLLKDKGQLHVTFDRYLKKYGDAFAMYFLGQPAVFVVNPDLLKRILVKDFTRFHDRPSFGLEWPEPLKSMMSLLTGERWRKVRKILSPTFTSGKLKRVTDTMRKSSETFLSKLADVADTDKSVDIYGLLQNVTMDVILSSAFGVESACQTNPDDIVSRYAKESSNPRAWFQLVMRIPVFGKALTKKLFPTDYGLRYGNLQRVAEKIIAQRKSQHGTKYEDMLQMAIEAQDPDQKGIQLTDQEVLAQSLIFLIAGYDTSSITLGMLCYHLAVDQDVQERLYDEIEAVMGDGPVEYEKLSQMVYMEAVISEVLRMYPPGFFLSRSISEDCDISGIPFRKHMAIIVPVYSLHRDERYWEEPDVFRPDRFLPENADNIKPFSYLPFGVGPRNCIGSRFAQLEIKYVIIHLLRKYRVEKGDNLCVPMKLAVKNVLTIGAPVDVKLTSRE